MIALRSTSLRRKQVVRLVGLALLVLIVVVVSPWTYYAGLGLVRREHFYHGLPATYWKSAISDWRADYGWSPSTSPTLLSRLRCWLGIRSGRPSIVDGDVAAIPVLVDLLQAKDEGVRSVVITALGEFGQTASPAIPAILAAARNGAAREETSIALARMGPDAVDGLTRCLEDDDTSVREWAVRTLGIIGARGAPAVPALIRTLADPELQGQVIETLGQIGTPARTAVPWLLALKRKWESERLVFDIRDPIWPSYHEIGEHDLLLWNVEKTLRAIDPEAMRESESR